MAHDIFQYSRAIGDDDVLIRPCKGPGEMSIPSSGIMVIPPFEAKEAIAMALRFGGRRQGLFNSKLCVVPSDLKDDKKGYFVAGPFVGAPMAVMTLEKLIALGARQVMVFGWCGALHDSLKGGDVFLPSGFHSEEGTSIHYPVEENCRPNENLLVALQAYLENKGILCQPGPIWTTDAPFRETRTKVTEYALKGIMAVDMEFSALTTVACFRRIKLVAVMIVSDELWRPNWTPIYNQKFFKKKSRQILNVLMIFLKTSFCPEF